MMLGYMQESSKGRTINDGGGVARVSIPVSDSRGKKNSSAGWLWENKLIMNFLPEPPPPPPDH